MFLTFSKNFLLFYIYILFIGYDKQIKYVGM